jgi:hypothetical protein
MERRFDSKYFQEVAHDDLHFKLGSSTSSSSSSSSTSSSSSGGGGGGGGGESVSRVLCSTSSVAQRWESKVTVMRPLSKKKNSLGL